MESTNCSEREDTGDGIDDAPTRGGIPGTSSFGGLGLPKEQRDELVADIEAHLAEALPIDASEAQVRTVLDRLGDPAQIVATEEQASTGARILGREAGTVGSSHCVDRRAGRCPLGWGLGVILDATRSPEAMSVSVPLMIVGEVVGWAVGVVLLSIPRCGR